jgi:biopolymer transport protein TolR
MTPKWVGKGYRARPVMNVTPLVDVVLVLLIIFMVVIPAMEQGLAIEIPGIHNVDDKKSNAQPFSLSITKEGDVYLEDEQVPLDQIQARLKAAVRKEPGRRMLLRGDKDAPYARVRKLYRMAQEVGFAGVSLKVNHRQEEGAIAKR